MPSPPPFGGPEAVLACLSRYTHRVAIPNHRLISDDAGTVAFRWKDDRIKRGAPLPDSVLRSNTTRGRMKVMRLSTDEFIRRFLIHVLPSGFHRIRHAGFLANGIRRDRIAKVRRWLNAESEPVQASGAEKSDNPDMHAQKPCPKCGGPMSLVETFLRGHAALLISAWVTGVMIYLPALRLIFSLVLGRFRQNSYFSHPETVEASHLNCRIQRNRGARLSRKAANPSTALGEACANPLNINQQVRHDSPKSRKPAVNQALRLMRRTDR